jgi:xanthine dehydrogenase accessory factor
VYDIALSVAACARSGTRADVAWTIAPAASDEAIAFTPGGGRIGGLMNGAFDGLLADVAQRQLPTGRRVTHTVSDLESQISGLPSGTVVEFLVVPADQLPLSVWPALLDRQSVAITASLAGDIVEEVTVATRDEALEADRELIAEGRPAVRADASVVTTIVAPIQRLVVAGQGPIADALAAQALLLEWKPVVEARPAMVAGLAASLSPIDAIVVMGHDVETSSTCLLAALESDAGYIGALGSHAMQQARADWLAYRDVTDLRRVNGPAGIDIGAQTPAEIAVSIASQIILVHRGNGQP